MVLSKDNFFIEHRLPQQLLLALLKLRGHELNPMMVLLRTHRNMDQQKVFSWELWIKERSLVDCQKLAFEILQFIDEGSQSKTEIILCPCSQLEPSSWLFRQGTTRPCQRKKIKILIPRTVIRPSL
jgi:hypothetical protein